MLKLPVTTVEMFNYWRNSTMSQEDFIQRLTQPFKPTIQMQFGTAYHSLIEEDLGKFKVANHFEVGDIVISEAVADPILGYKANYPDLTHEVKLKKVYQVGKEEIFLSGKVDALFGLEIHEHKTTGYFKDFSKYKSSYQWRFYLDMLPEAKRFLYNIFVFDKVPEATKCNLKQLELEPYANLQRDCEQLLEDFVEFIFKHNLQQRFTIQS